MVIIVYFFDHSLLSSPIFKIFKQRESISLSPTLIFKTSKQGKMKTINLPSPLLSFIPLRSSFQSSLSRSPSACFNVVVKLPHISLHSTCTNASSMDIWHCHLGHPHARVLQHVLSSHLHKHVPTKLPFCKHCVQGKMT